MTIYNKLQAINDEYYVVGSKHAYVYGIRHAILMWIKQ